MSDKKMYDILGMFSNLNPQLKPVEEEVKTEPVYEEVESRGAIMEAVKSLEEKFQTFKEAAKPDYLDLDKDGDKKEPMKKAAKDAKKLKEDRMKVTVNGKPVDMHSLEFDDVHQWDAPDYSDAYVKYAEYNDGTELSEKELAELQDKFAAEVNMALHDSLHEGIEDKIAAAREKAAAKGLTKEKEPEEKPASRFVKGSAYGGSKQKDEKEKDDLDEVAPPGAKAERMVKHIKKAYSKDGKLTPKEKSIAYATAWKAHNKGQVEEAVKFSDKVKNSSPNMKKVKVVAESRAMVTEETLGHILDRFPHEVKKFKQGGDMDENLYDALYDYYLLNGEMPYGVAKARAGDPMEWICNRLEDELGLHEVTNDNSELHEIAKLAGLQSEGAAWESKAWEAVDNQDLDFEEVEDDEDFDEEEYERRMRGFALTSPSAANGTSYQGDFDAWIDPSKYFGPANSDGDGYKVTHEWVIEFDDGTIATIYDYKGDKWHIGGHDKRAVRRVQEVLDGPELFEDSMEEGNEFSGALAKAKASGAKAFEVDGKTYPVKENTSINDILKLSGLQEVVEEAVEELEEARDVEHANTPKEKTFPLSAAIPNGTDLNKKKKQYRKEYPGDNPSNMGESKEEALWKSYESMINEIKE